MNINKSLLPLYTVWYAKKISRKSSLDVRKMHEWQNKKSKQLLVYAYKNHEFYRDRFDACGFDPYSFSDQQDLRKLPVLTKEEYRSFVESEVQKRPNKYAKWSCGSTSGSSGTPLKIIRSWRERALMDAKWLSALQKNGYKFSDRYCRFTPHKRSIKKASLFHRLGLTKSDFVSCSTPAEEMYLAYQAARPDILAGTRAPLVQLATYAKRNELPIHQPKICGVGGEVIDEISLEVLTSSFGEKSFVEIYGCEELGGMAFQSRGARGLLWTSATTILELENISAEESDKEGDVVVTDLYIKSFPLIRYQVGDRVRMSLDKNTGVEYVSKVYGRSNDWLVWRDNTRSNFNGFYTVMSDFAKEIAQFRVVQETVDYIRILVVLVLKENEQRTKAYLKKEIVSKMQSEMRGDVRYDVEFVDSIPPDQNGKIRMIVSKVAQEYA